MADFSVHEYGHDLYGRPVLLTAFMHDWFEEYVENLGWRPGIEQGAFMSRLGGGAAASSGAHDLGGCIDLQTTGNTDDQIDHMVRVAREHGGAGYRRDRTWRHGSMPQHLHITLGADRPLSDMAEILWSSYVGGGDGLGIQPPQSDYEWRPVPLILTPPKDWFDMATKAQLKDAIREVLAEDLVAVPANDPISNTDKVPLARAVRRIWNLAANKGA